MCSNSGTWDTCNARVFRDFSNGASAWFLGHSCGYENGAGWYIPGTVDYHCDALYFNSGALPYGYYEMTISGTAYDWGGSGAWIDIVGIAEDVSDERVTGSGWSRTVHFSVYGSCGDAPIVLRYRGGFWGEWMRIGGVNISRIGDP